ncbi:hypothetical protein F6R98_02435 [Candidatus Methylospira mobilis]|uniref:Clan AA aspartic protease n=1 Tax=Candidatus Methylospira mobilis TaxID=1808979 RepID=A0A5Q0BER4_9GAMM|nr:retropepsin-like aspartic protease [Candidatus Methylospira mobilis]QFY41622.1 hypothetical protein F6R98_02435 [Candidatus Methylospira mobilis]WNV05129.1 retropepsin-like aspartic protease [Candidatus Methylospira mobilis]
MKRLILMIACVLPFGLGFAGEADKHIAMRQSDAGTFYVPVHLKGGSSTDFLIDTGSSHTVINENTLAVLKENGAAKYAYDIKGVMADGSIKMVSVYLIQSIDIGHHCILNNVEAAVFPGESRQILGLSTLSKTSSFMFTMSPPSLLLSNCQGNISADNAPTKVSALQ